MSPSNSSVQSPKLVKTVQGKAPKAPKLNEAQKAELVVQIQRTLARAKGGYQRADKLFGDLLPSVRAGERISCKAGEFEVVDNFKENNTAFRIARVKRFELKAVKSEKAKPAKKK